MNMGGTQYQLNSLHFINSNTGYATGYGGSVYITTNGGLNWYKQLTPTRFVLFSVFFTDSITGYVIGENGTIIKTINGGAAIGIPPISNNIPKSWLLYQNYPNPFNPSTKIRFALPKGSFAKLVVYDILGREVQTLVNEQLQPGTYEVEWNASKYSSGVYCYKLITQSFTETKKMVLIK